MEEVLHHQLGWLKLVETLEILGEKYGFFPSTGVQLVLPETTYQLVLDVFPSTGFFVQLAPTFQVLGAMARTGAVEVGRTRGTLGTVGTGWWWETLTALALALANHKSGSIWDKWDKS